MAIYSCSLASIGRTTHAAGTAGAHLRYISREGAAPIVEANGMPADPTDARTWMDRQEANARANARLIDKVRIAIPRELSGEQRVQLVRDFVSGITQDRVPWMFAIHQTGEDAHNPHAHIVLRDCDRETGKRVLRLSDSARDRVKAGLAPKAVEWIRERWEHYANDALGRAGHEVRIDRRTLEAQGIDRAPTIHVGPRGEKIDQLVQRPTSKRRTDGTGREIDYPGIDQGRTRKDRNAEIVDMNLARAARSPDVETRLWARFERDQIKLDRALESELAAQARNRTREERQVKASFRAKATELRAERAASYQHELSDERQEMRGSVVALRERQAAERQGLRGKQSSLWSRVSRTLDITGVTRRKQMVARQEQVARHRAERSLMARNSHARRIAMRHGIAQRFDPQLDGLQAKRLTALAAMREMHQRGENIADAKRQLREAAREQERLRTAEEIRMLKTKARDGKANDLCASPSGEASGAVQQRDRGRTPSAFSLAVQPIARQFEGDKETRRDELRRSAARREQDGFRRPSHGR